MNYFVKGCVQNVKQITFFSWCVTWPNLSYHKRYMYQVHKGGVQKRNITYVPNPLIEN
jgi:hypothetical protein